MCTVIVHVPEDGAHPTRLLAIRDEDPGRPWDPLGPWWPADYPGVVGVRDLRAGGAWMAADRERARVAVLLNRHDLSSRTEAEVTTRGALALEAVAGRPPGAAPSTRGFNLVDVHGGRVTVVAWDGVQRRSTTLAPGVHMIAHDDVDDPRTARIGTWIDAFRSAPPRAADVAGAHASWWEPWLEVIGRSAALPADDDRALIRDQRFEGFVSQSLLVCAASVGPAGADVVYGALPRPGSWARVPLQPPV